MTNTNQQIMLAKMIELAATKHGNQFDKGGNPYILHVLHVMNTVESKDLEVKQIAVGHDLIEDTDVTVAMLTEMGFSERVIQGIAALTKIPNQEHFEYKQRVKSNPDAVVVKMADLLHNSDLRRLKGVTEKDFSRMNKYMEFYHELKQLTDAWKRV